MPLRREDVITLATRYLTLADQLRELTNAVNREKTTLRNHMKKYIEEQNHPIGFGFQIGDKVVKYGLGKGSQIVPPSVVIGMYKRGEIDEKQLGEIIDVRKGDAERVLGADVVATVEEFQQGKEVDLRIVAPETMGAIEKAIDVLPVEPPKVKRETKAVVAPKQRLIRIGPPRIGIKPLPTREPGPLRRIS